MWGRKPTQRVPTYLTTYPYSKNAPIQMTPISLMGKMIPDVPRAQTPVAPVSHRKLFLERYGKLESHLLAFDTTPLGG